jgi:zinc D-Ala-D-Ala dipeptidase
MKFLRVFLFLIPCLAFGQTADNELINVRDVIPDAVIDLKYNTIDNFFNVKLYTTDECYLAHVAVRHLAVVQDSLKKLGLGIKVWDGYRPRTVQYLMWEILPNPVYVADPNSGSNHNRGAAVDVTLVDLSTGQELNMPTEFDYFGNMAHHDWTLGLTLEQISNRDFLRDMMVNVGGFTLYDAEWWHYTYNPAASYPLLDFQLK